MFIVDVKVIIIWQPCLILSLYVPLMAESLSQSVCLSVGGVRVSGANKVLFRTFLEGNNTLGSVLRVRKKRRLVTYHKA